MLPTQCHVSLGTCIVNYFKSCSLSSTPGPGSTARWWGSSLSSEQLSGPGQSGTSLVNITHPPVNIMLVPRSGGPALGNGSEWETKSKRQCVMFLWFPSTAQGHREDARRGIGPELRSAERDAEASLRCCVNLCWRAFFFRFFFSLSPILEFITCRTSFFLLFR